MRPGLAWHGATSAVGEGCGGRKPGITKGEATSAGPRTRRQFFFYGMGDSQMGAYRFSGWTLHMAFIIAFSSLWGLYLHE